MNAKPSPPKRKRDKVLFIAVTEAEHRQIAELAEKNSRTISEEVLKRLKTTLDNPAWERPASELLKQVLIGQGWIEHHDPRYGGPVLLPPGSAVPGPLIVNGKELPTATSSESVEKTLRGVFAAFDIPVEQRGTLRHALLDALTKITGTLAANEAPDTASFTASVRPVEKGPKRDRKEERRREAAHAT